MSFFYINRAVQKPRNSSVYENSFKIHNTNVPYREETISGQVTFYSQGFYYRPAIRMQFVPKCDSADVYFYPEQVILLKDADYNVDFENGKRDDELQGDFSWTYRILQNTNVNETYQEAEQFTIDKILENWEFKQLVAYERLQFEQLVFAKGEKIVLKINVYCDNTTSLYQSEEIDIETIENETPKVIKVKNKVTNQLFVSLTLPDDYFDNNVQICSECNGTGKVGDSQNICDKCKNGYILTSYKLECVFYKAVNLNNDKAKINYYHNNSEASQSAFCEHCNGSGTVQKQQTCTICNGTGQIKKDYTYKPLFGTTENIDQDKYAKELFASNNNVYFFKGKEIHRWLIDDNDNKHYCFARSNYTDTTNNITNQTIRGYTYIFNAQNQMNFRAYNSDIDNIPYVIYVDYLKEDGFGLDNNDKDFNCYISVRFKSYKKDAVGEVIHSTLQHYQYAFSKQFLIYPEDQTKLPSGNIHTDQQYAVGESLMCSSIKTSEFKINDKNNVKDGDYLRNEGIARYINSNSLYLLNVKTTSEYKRPIVKYRYSETPFDKKDDDNIVKWHEVNQPYFNTDFKNTDFNVKIIWKDAESISTKKLYFQVADNYFNVSDIVYSEIIVYLLKPTSLFLKLLGENNNSQYTGVKISDKNQEFSISNKIKVQFSAYSDLQLQYKIEGDIYDQNFEVAEDGSWIVRKYSEYTKFSATDNLLTLQLTPVETTEGNVYDFKYNHMVVNSNANDNLTQAEQLLIKNSLTQGILNCNHNKAITVTFKDEAGNVASITKEIFFNTRLFKSSKKNFREPSSTYDLQLYKTVNNANILINRTDNSQDLVTVTRNWQDIFYPATHGYPTLANGQIDQTTTQTITKPTNSYDPVLMNNGKIVYDEHGRATTSWDNSKKYDAMVSSYGNQSDSYSGFVYWIIDNQGYGDITLQFEHFYLDNVAYGPPFNQNLGQRPDSLIVYDASADGCVGEETDQYGKTVFKLKDTTKLKQLQVYSGYGVNTMSLLTGTVNAGTNGQFVTQAFSTERLCLIFYSDSRNSTDSPTSSVGSGFKIKGAHQIVKYWQNFDVDSTNGLIWTHLSNKLSGVSYPGQAIENARLTYDYYNTRLTINYDQGSVVFDENPQGGLVYATYTYYTYDATENPKVRTFMLDQDDLVDYADLNVYYTPSGVTPIKVGNVTPIYYKGQQAVYSAGKLNNNIYYDKDRGVVQFANAVAVTEDEYGYVPRGRLFADYRYHTFDRLGNDGYSDFEFNDSMLIAGITSQYPDYTWGDIKIVNQGDTQLRDGKLIFLARGQVENNQIKSVLDYDRPWDVQQGTAEETYDKVAVVIRSNYAWNSYSCTRDQAKSLFGSSSVNTFPDAIKPKQVFYGRIVYVLGGKNDSYPATTAGRKTFSSEISGRFIQVD